MLCGLPRSLPLVQVYLCTSVGPWGATRRSTYPTLRHSESGPLSLSVRECGVAGSASGQTACPIGPTLRQSRSRHGNVSPLRLSYPSLPLLPVWMNVYFLFPWCQTSLPFNFLSVLVVRGGAVCLPSPLSWFSPGIQFFIVISYSPLYLSAVCCSLSSFISDCVYLGPLSFFLHEPA